MQFRSAYILINYIKSCASGLFLRKLQPNMTYYFRQYNQYKNENFFYHRQKLSQNLSECSYAQHSKLSTRFLIILLTSYSLKYFINNL